MIRKDKGGKRKVKIGVREIKGTRGHQLFSLLLVSVYHIPGPAQVAPQLASSRPTLLTSLDHNASSHISRLYSHHFSLAFSSLSLAIVYEYHPHLPPTHSPPSLFFSLFSLQFPLPPSPLIRYR